MSRRLRIAASVFFAALTIVLAVLWVRSYWVVNNWQSVVVDHRALQWCSRHGGMYFAFHSFRTAEDEGNFSPHFGNYRYGTPEYALWVDDARPTFELRRITDRYGTHFAFVRLPYWFAMLSGGVLSAIAPFWKWRFSLRTLLIATTLIAVLLGSGIWLAS